jgi:predicted lipoprotein with Yx(FWY)xxD motif
MSRAGFALASATALAALAVITACGSGSNTAAPASPSGPAGLAVADVGSLGKVVTAADGKTLYRFEKDSTNPTASNCDGQCAALWPPVIAGSATVNVQGIDKSLLGTVKRKDGSEQVTVAGYPVYEFANDKVPGQANGQGVMGLWFAVTPTGDKAGQSAPATSSSSGGGYGGY